MKHLSTTCVVLLALVLLGGTRTSTQAPQATPLRIISFGAHPDDAELKSAGVAAMWAAQGHKVKLVAMTNGDIGHWSLAGGPLAARRIKEAAECGRILGTESQVLDIHDGELVPSLENRRTVARLIRDWQADVVVMGVHASRSGPWGAFGATTARVVRHAPCPVLTVPAGSSARVAEVDGRLALAAARS